MPRIQNDYAKDRQLVSDGRPILNELISTAVRSVVLTCFLLIGAVLFSSFHVTGYFNFGTKFSVFPENEKSTDFYTALSFLKESPFQKIDTLEKWSKPIKVKFEGKYTEKDIAVLEKISAAFSTIKGFPGMELVSKGENVTVSYISSSEYAEYADKYHKDKDDPTSFCFHTSQNGAINKGHIVIVKKWPQGFQNSEVLHEFYHLVGFYSHTQKRDSILNEVGPVATLSATDVLAFKMIYNPDVKVGWKYAQIQSYYNKVDIGAYVTQAETAKTVREKPALVIPMIAVAVFLMLGFFRLLKRSGVVTAVLSLLTGVITSAVVFALYYGYYEMIISLLPI